MDYGPVGTNVINPPEVRCAWNKPVRIQKSGKSNDKIRHTLIAPEHLGGALLHIDEILPKVHIIRGGSYPLGPVQNRRRQVWGWLQRH
jgi:hypothetical protein